MWRKAAVIRYMYSTCACECTCTQLLSATFANKVQSQLQKMPSMLSLDQSKEPSTTSGLFWLYHHCIARGGITSRTGTSTDPSRILTPESYYADRRRGRSTTPCVQPDCRRHATGIVTFSDSISAALTSPFAATRIPKMAHMAATGAASMAMVPRERPTNASPA